MKPSILPDRHLNHDELLEVLEGSPSEHNEQIDAASAHLESCAACREQLEQLAANPRLWDHAATLLDHNVSGDTLALGSFAFGCPEVATDGNQDSLPSIRHLLDKPVHPEMLGRLGGYDIEREIGRGGMGVVLKAFDSELNRPVAIKIMSPLLAGRGAARERFAREARAAAAILHPNVIAIHGISVTDQIPWLVMPYITGPSLEQVVAETGPLPERDIARIALQIASGLAAAHAQGVVHRDIKPANILIENGVGRVVITDFGLARAENDVSMTQTGWFAGTPTFMSPEQACGQHLDHRSDLFSLGSVMYYMATGRYPFRAEQPMAILERIRNEYPSPARLVNSEVSLTMSRLIERLLAKDPDDRIQTAAALQQILEQYVAHLQQPMMVRQPRIALPRRRSAGWSRGGAVAALMALSALGGIGLWTLLRPPVAAPPGPTLAEQYQSIQDEFGLWANDHMARQISEIEAALQSAQQSVAVVTADVTANDDMQHELDALEARIASLEMALGEFEEPAVKSNE